MFGWLKKKKKMRLFREEGQKEERNSTFNRLFLCSDLGIKVEVKLRFRLLVGLDG